MKTSTRYGSEYLKLDKPGATRLVELVLVSDFQYVVGLIFLEVIFTISSSLIHGKKSTIKSIPQDVEMIYGNHFKFKGFVLASNHQCCLDAFSHFVLWNLNPVIALLIRLLNTFLEDG
ncbi:hypothetical protein QVD17_34617 [Tagetes erecta]|uniref:Uncharacterized protein n=1 Tax=Tagetes erecta TaxID=13708 RepID=A0AAD8K0T7_TARER|nr:hypothetical protein QVD17_34617 [Tagetes erecta]